MAIDEPLDINTFEKIAALRASPIYLSYPKIYQKNLIPDDVFVALNQRWSTERYLAPPVNFYLLKDVYVLAEGLVFTGSGKLIAQTKANHSQHDIDVARSALSKGLENSGQIRSIKKGVLCKKRGSANYGHWVVEMLPKAFLAKHFLGISDWPLIVHETSIEMRKVVQQSLESVGFRKEIIITADSSPFHCDEIIVVDGLTVHSIFISPVVLECMEHISAAAPRGRHESIYATRRPSKTRDFENEQQIKGIFEDDGFSEIVTAELPFLEQVGTFKTAKRVVGPMGAALTNIIFCRPGTEITLFSPASARELFFWHIAEGKKLNYQEVRCEETGPQQGPLPWDRSLSVPMEVARDALRCIETSRIAPTLPLERSIHLPTVGNVTEELLRGKDWGWRLSSDPSSTRVFQFAANGDLPGHSHANETAWKIENGFLRIYNSDRVCTWLFDEFFHESGRLRLRGTYCLDSRVIVVAFLDHVVNS